MNYIGSKHRLLDFIERHIRQVMPKIDDAVFCDLFAGTGAVAGHFKNKVKTVIANDIEDYAYILNAHQLSEQISARESQLLDILNQTDGKDGLFYTHYSQSGPGNRLYFSDDNARKIDGIRQQIQQWDQQGSISPSETISLLAHSLKALDKVANTASVYAAFLKTLKKTAQKPLILEQDIQTPSQTPAQVYQEDANTLISKISGDILYLDPPYNGRQYGNYYHILNTFICYDSFEPKGKTGLRPYYRSKYCQKKQVLETFQDLIKNAQFKTIFLSYNNEGLMSLSEIQDILSQFGEYHCFETIHTRFKADKNRAQLSPNTTEYLHCLIKANIDTDKWQSHLGAQSLPIPANGLLTGSH